MPGPIVTPITANPQPIVANRGPNEVANALSLLNAGVKVWEQMKQQDDSTYLGEVAKKVNAVKIGVSNGQYTQKDAIVMVDKITNDALGVEGKEHLYSQLGSINRSFDTDTGLNTIANINASEQKAREAALEAEIAQFTQYNISPDDPNRYNKLDVAMRTESRTEELRRQNELRDQQNILTSDDKKKEGFAVGATLFNNNANKWNEVVGTSEKAWLAKTPEDIASIQVSMKNDLRTAKAMINNNYGEFVSKEDEERMLQNLTEEYNFVLSMMNGETTYKQYQKRNEYNNAVATTLEAPTPQSVAYKRLKEQMLNSRNAQLFLNIVKIPGLTDKLSLEGEAFLRRLSSDDPSSITTLSTIESKAERGQVAAELLTVFSTYDQDIPVELKNMLTNVTKNMEITPEMFTADSWDALVDFAGGDKIPTLKGKAEWESLITTLDGGLDNYANLLLGSAIESIPDGAEVFIGEDGKLDLRETESTHIYNKMGNNFIRDRQLESWRQDYGQRINKLAQAGSNIRGGTVNENIQKLSEISGLVTVDASVDEVMFTELEKEILAELRGGDTNE